MVKSYLIENSGFSFFFLFLSLVKWTFWNGEDFRVTSLLACDSPEWQLCLESPSPGDALCGVPPVALGGALSREGPPWLVKGLAGQINPLGSSRSNFSWLISRSSIHWCVTTKVRTVSVLRLVAHMFYERTSLEGFCSMGKVTTFPDSFLLYRSFSHSLV
jgi:hypothetical protein